jgi:hypothetical protein
MERKKTLAEKFIEYKPRNPEVEEYRQLRNFRNIQEEYPILYEQRQAVSRPGELKRTIEFQTPEGMIEEERILLCNTCHKQIHEEYTVCYSCGLVVCPECSVYWQGANICKACLEEKIPFSKRGFKVLLALANKITSTRRISKLAKIPIETVLQIEQDLLYAGLIELRGWIIKDFDVTDYGQQLIDAFGKIYSREGDVQQFLLAMDKYFWRS